MVAFSSLNSLFPPESFGKHLPTALRMAPQTTAKIFPTASTASAKER